jgi:hypothetical protein
MADQLGGATHAWRTFSALVPRIRGTKLVELLIVIGIIALVTQTSLRVFSKAMSNKTKEQVTVSSDSDCVGGLCTVQVIDVSAPPKAP